MNKNISLFIVGFLLLVVGIRLSLISIYADSIPYWDDFGIGNLLYLYETGKLTAADIFVDANEHRLVFNRLLSIIFFEANQHQWDQKIPMVFNSILWGIVGIILFRIVFENVDFPRNVLPLILIAVYWLVPISLVNILWGVQTHTYTMLLFTVMGLFWSSRSGHIQFG